MSPIYTSIFLTTREHATQHNNAIEMSANQHNSLARIIAHKYFTCTIHFHLSDFLCINHMNTPRVLHFSASFFTAIPTFFFYTCVCVYIYIYIYTRATNNAERASHMRMLE